MAANRRTIDAAVEGPGETRAELCVEGRNAWRCVQASRLAVLIDADAYFRAFVEAVVRARDSILILGWDIQAATRLQPAERMPDGLPATLREFLNAVLERRPGQPSFRHTQETILAQMQSTAARPQRPAGEGEAIAPEFFRQTGAPKKIEAIDQGIACFRRREYEQALEFLQSACKQHPDLPPARVMLARLYLADGQAAPARSAFDKAADEHPGAARRGGQAGGGGVHRLRP